MSSGRVVDTNVYANYHYAVDQAYSEDRWCIVGDAAFAPDPLFSNGLSFSTVQIEQIGEMVARDHDGDHSPDYIRRLEEIFWAPITGSQNTIAKWYENMEDPLLCAARLHFIEVSYFFVLLPLIMNRCHYDPARLDEWNVLTRTAGRPLSLPKRLLEKRAELNSVLPEHFIYQGKEKVSLKALTRYDDLRDVRREASVGARLLGSYVDALVERWSARDLEPDGMPSR